MPRQKSATGSGSKKTSPDSEESKYGSWKSSSATDGCEFASTDVQTLARAIDAVIDAGDAIILGRTSDGGAVCFTILEGTSRTKEYAASQEELDKLISDLALVLDL